MLETIMQTVEAMVKRSHVVVGTCGECKSPITRVDLLVAGSCPKCYAKLSLQLVAEKPKEISDQNKRGLPAFLGVFAVASSENWRGLNCQMGSS